MTLPSLRRSQSANGKSGAARGHTAVAKRREREPMRRQKTRQDLMPSSLRPRVNEADERREKMQADKPSGIGRWPRREVILREGFYLDTTPTGRVLGRVSVS